MAQLKLEDGQIFTDLNDIRRELASLRIELSHWPIEKTQTVGALLKADVLTDSQKEELLKGLDARFEEQKAKYGYQTRDLVVLHAETPNIDSLLKIFDKCHRHSDDEVRYIVDGSGVFGFCLPNGQQALLTVESEEYIRVPAETEHWFVLDENRRIKAVRYFTSKEGWVAKYSGTGVRLEQKSIAAELAEVGRFFAHQGWSPATSSNYSVKINDETLAISRSGIDKFIMSENDVIEVNLKTGEPTKPNTRSSAETLIHTAIYRLKPTASAVLHTHSAHNTRLSLKFAKQGELIFTGYELQKGLSGISDHSSQIRLPILNNAQDMVSFSKVVEKLLTEKNDIQGFLIEGHGLYTWGRSLNEAKRHIETFEFLMTCKILEITGA